MTTRVYEGMFILDSNHYARDASGVSGKIQKTIENCDGQVLVSRLWSEQKLAYPINGRRKGTYWLTYFRMDSSRQEELLRQCKLNESILRNLVLTVDDRLVDALVAHAEAGGSSSARGTSGDDSSGKTGASADKADKEKAEKRQPAGDQASAE